MMQLVRNNWRLDDKQCDAETLQQFSSVENVFACSGEQVVKDKISEVVRFSCLSNIYYIKRYIKSGHKLFSFFRKSRICQEWENLVSLTRIGLPVPNIVAHGEIVKRGRFLKGALITEGVEYSENLAQHLASNTALISNKKWLYLVIDQLAHYVAKMHEQKFIHRDLNLRNILVTTQGNPVVYFIDCPAGGFKRAFWLTHGIIRDLAHLDKVARYLLSDKDLLRFYKQYKKIDKLAVGDKKLIAQIRHFHDKHRAKQSRKADKLYRVI
jgi:tRNA A-37 threonylcarbamoyl transferase component Bud32